MVITCGRKGKTTLYIVQEVFHILPFITRTDLASEAHALWQSSADKTTQLQGVIAREEKLAGFLVTNVDIISDEGAQALGKPQGRYSTLELERLPLHADGDFDAACHALAGIIARCLPQGAESFLIAALGNPDVTPDALGPLCAENVIVTRHLKRQMPDAFKAMSDVAVFRTGVLGTTGIESALSVSTLVSELRSDCVIAVDALAGSELGRLCRTVQVCDSGIAPGSGVGNDRAALSRDTLGVPVIAVGVPTVVDASGFGDDRELAGMFVTPRYIDDAVRTAARLIGYSVNLAVHPGISMQEVGELLN